MASGHRGRYSTSVTAPRESTNAREAKPISILGAFLLSALVMLSLWAVLAGAAGLSSLLRGIPFADALSAASSDPVNLGLAQLASLLFALWVGLVRYRPGFRPRVALLVRPLPARAIALAFLSGAALQFPLAELGNHLRHVWPLPPGAEAQLLRLLEIRSLGDALRVLMMFVVVAPVGEELLFRGLLLPGLARSYGRWPAVFASAFLFGLAHWEPVTAILATSAGLVLGAVMLRARSVLATIALHAGFNAAPVLLQRNIVRVEGFNTIGEGVYHQPFILWASASLVAALCLWAFFRNLEEESA